MSGTIPVRCSPRGRRPPGRLDPPGSTRLAVENPPVNRVILLRGKLNDFGTEFGLLGERSEVP